MAAKFFAQMLKQQTGCTFTVGGANWLKCAAQLGIKLAQVAVMRKNPMPSPQLTHKWMYIF